MRNLSPLISCRFVDDNSIVVFHENLIPNNLITNPYVIGKIEVEYDENAEWQLMLVFLNQEECLISSRNINFGDGRVDLIKELGHNLILFPNQKLLFYYHGELTHAFCYLELPQ